MQTESAHSLLNVPGRMWYVKNPGVRKPGCHDTQKWVSESRPIKGYGSGAVIQCEIRFDDECRNGHNTFAITAGVTTPASRRRRDFEACGCLHDDIAQVFPELAPLIRWHLVSTDGPMHYLANALYLAGDRDYNGRVKGEPCAWDDVVYFGTSPVSHKIGAKFSAFLQSSMVADQDGGHYLNPAHGEFRVVAIAHEGRPGDTYKFGPKYTFAGFGQRWHECPFDDKITADEWATALNSIRCEFVKIPTRYSEGKARELDKARNAACWPEATDEELSAPREILAEKLAARLPGLLAEFRADIERIGFRWMADDVNG